MGSFEGFPGADLVVHGIRDLDAGRESIASLLVSIGALRLSRAGIHVDNPIPAPEHRLYALLSRWDPDSAHTRYNALVRRLVSFERALECVS